MTTAEDATTWFPVDLSTYVKLKIDPYAQEALSPEQRGQLQHNIQLCRDAIVFFTACGQATGYGGHTGGAYDTVPGAAPVVLLQCVLSLSFVEVMLLDAMFRGRPDKFNPTFFDEAGEWRVYSLV